MKVSMASAPGQLFEARLGTRAGPGGAQAVLEVAANGVVQLDPSQALGCTIVEATPDELAALRRAGFRCAYHPPGKKLGDDPMMRMVLPVGRSGWAIAAGYAGLFALLVLPAPLALVLGAVAAWDLRKNPKKRGWGRTIFGLLMGTLGTGLMLLALFDAF